MELSFFTIPLKREWEYNKNHCQICPFKLQGFLHDIIKKKELQLFQGIR